MENVKRVKVKVENSKRAYIVDMDKTVLRAARKLKPYAAKDGYLYFYNKDGERVMFLRHILNVTDSDLVVSFKDGNHLNLTLENLEVITKAERGKRNLTGKRGQKVERGIYFIEREGKYMVSVLLPNGQRKCPRAKTLEAARILRDRLYELHGIHYWGKQFPQ